MRTNGNIVKVTARSIVSSAAFGKGFADRLSGKPFDPEAFTSGHDQWGYERGRLLACVFRGKLRDGRGTVRLDALSALITASRRKEIV